MHPDKGFSTTILCNMAGYRVEWIPGSMVSPRDFNDFIRRARANVFTEWKGFPLLGAHCFAPP
eukprot:9751933-Prorocentrum_lima.AAC.1